MIGQAESIIPTEAPSAPFERGLIFTDPACKAVSQAAIEFLSADPLFASAEAKPTSHDDDENREMLEEALEDGEPTLVATIGSDAMFRSMALGLAQSPFAETPLLPVGLSARGRSDTLIAAMINGEQDRSEPPQLAAKRAPNIQTVHPLELLVHDIRGRQIAQGLGITAVGFGKTHAIGNIDYSELPLGEADRELLAEVGRGEHMVHVQDTLGNRYTLGQDMVNGSLFFRSGHRRDQLLFERKAALIEPLSDVARIPEWLLGRRSGGWPSWRQIEKGVEHSVRILNPEGTTAYVDESREIEVPAGSIITIRIADLAFRVLANSTTAIRKTGVPWHAHLDAVIAAHHIHHGRKTSAQKK